MAGTILIVEDDDQLRELLKIVLMEEDFNVEIAPDGQEAINFLTKAKADGKLPNMILLDLNMPVVDGWKVAAWLNGDPDLRDIPLVVTSATQEHGERAKALGADAYLVKPFSTDEILGVVSLLSFLNG
ncbi:MAG: response regulator [Anaerolineae bacterium]|nr:response regulator [Anaerolineae bacterium]